MHRRCRLTILIVAVITVVGILELLPVRLPRAPQASCNFVENGESQRISWGANLPVVLYVDQSVPSEYYDAIRLAMDEWNQSIGRDVLELGGVTKDSTGPAHDNRNVIYFLKNWDQNKTYEQARTTVYWTDERISEADIRVNTHDFIYSSSRVPTVGQVDFQSLMLHEMGHVLGLAHTTAPGSVMVKTLPNAQGRLPSDVLRRKVSQFDLSSIHCEYPSQEPGPAIERTGIRVTTALKKSSILEPLRTDFAL